MNLKKLAVVIVPVVGLVFGVPSAVLASGNLVTNGGFETYTGGDGVGNPSQLANPSHGHTGLHYTTLTGWDNAGYNFLFAPGTAATTGSYSPQANNFLTLWSTTNGGITAIPASSPDGGNFVALDGAFGVGAISQTLG